MQKVRFTIQQRRAIAHAFAGAASPEYSRGNNPYGEEQPWHDFDGAAESLASDLFETAEARKFFRHVRRLTT